MGCKFSGFVDDLIGIQPRVEALERILKLGLGDCGFRVLGIRGMGGIGKTTLATVLYDRISHQFQASCFIENVSKIYKDGGCVAVQKQIICQTLRDKNLEACRRPSEISMMVRSRLHNIKVLVVLDDIDQIEQLQELHINPKLLCGGSRIIITTRDEHILKEYGADEVYEAQLMSDGEALDLLHRKAFKSDNSSSTFSELIPQVLKYAEGLPLAIRVIGSFLCTRNATQWGAALEGLRNNPLGNRVMKVLQISFEGLEPREKEIFLHIACFFKGEKVDYVRGVLDACGLHPDIGIPLIVEKSLITIRNTEIHMHGMLQELGKQIVRGQHPYDPEFWSRLWLYQDFHRVAMSKMVTYLYRFYGFCILKKCKNSDIIMLQD